MVKDFLLPPCDDETYFLRHLGPLRTEMKSQLGEVAYYNLVSGSKNLLEESSIIHPHLGKGPRLENCSEFLLLMGYEIGSMKDALVLPEYLIFGLCRINLLNTQFLKDPKSIKVMVSQIADIVATGAVYKERRYRCLN